MNKTVKIKLLSSFAVLMLNIICTACVYFFSIETTLLKIIGSFVAVVMASAAVWIFPVRFYFATVVFVFFASSLGSCLNLYRHVGFYDLFVHYLSGVLLYEGGRIIIEYVNARRKLPCDTITVGLFSLFFSCSCAAFWEIFEYVCDVLINAGMQGSKGNTMGDIIAGVLGAFSTMLAFYVLKFRKRKEMLK